MEDQNQPMKNLYLIGFMGVGKSHFGRIVSEALNFQFFDTDHVIENNEQTSISEIFKYQGEETFRKLERVLIESGLPNEACVIACGGGLATQEGMIDLLKSKGVVIALFASKETILERTSRNKNRPLLDVDNPEKRISEMMDERMPKYLGADASISTDGRTITDIMHHIIRTYRTINKVKSS
jgi:shikimate kinase